MLPSNRKVFGAALAEALDFGSVEAFSVVFALALALVVKVGVFALVLEVASALEAFVETEETDSVSEGPSREVSPGPGGGW